MKMSQFNIIMNDSHLPENNETILSICKLNKDNYSTGGVVSLTARDILTLIEIATEAEALSRWNRQRRRTIGKFERWQYYERA
jgi:hypothetical protein